MRRLIALGGVLLLAVLLMGAQAAQTAADKSQSVINLENAWNQAEARHDGGALKLLLAETFVYTDYDGSLMDRDQWLRRVQSEAKDYQSLVRAYGDTV
jgi:hypothetical protein